MDFLSYISSFNKVLQSTSVTYNGNTLTAQQGFDKCQEIMTTLKQTDKSCFMVGNGGSSGIVSHSMVDFVNTCKIKTHAITDNSLLTCMANDYGYENVFKQPLDTLISKGDMLVCVSSSGNSKNIVNAAELGKEKEATVITFSGFKPENNLRAVGNLNFWVDSTSYGFVEIGHALLLHYITDVFSNIINTIEK